MVESGEKYCNHASALERQLLLPGVSLCNVLAGSKQQEISGDDVAARLVIQRCVRK